jgi:hypothetical protein
MLTGGLTYYFDAAKTISASGLMRFERNGKNDMGFRNGNQVTLEWGLGKHFGAVQAGLVGYSQWQISDDKGPVPRASIPRAMHWAPSWSTRCRVQACSSRARSTRKSAPRPARGPCPRVRWCASQ